jgi:hypothetical protein
MGKKEAEPGTHIRLKRTERIFLMHRDVSLSLCRRSMGLCCRPSGRLIARRSAGEFAAYNRVERDSSHSKRGAGYRNTARASRRFHVGACVEPFNFESQPVQTIGQEMAYF